MGSDHGGCQPICVWGWGVGVELLTPTGLGATLGWHARARRTWGTLPLLPSLQLTGGCCPTSHLVSPAQGGPPSPCCSLPSGTLGPPTCLTVRGAPASPERCAKLGQEVGHLPNRTAITGCLGPWGQAFGDEFGDETGAG